MPTDPGERCQVMQWLSYQVSGLGPNQGGANVFSRYMPEKIDWVIERYRRETRRIYGVLNEHLSAQDYLTDEYSIADMATYPWVRFHFWAGVELDGLDHLQQWVQRIADRPAVQYTKDTTADINLSANS